MAEKGIYRQYLSDLFTALVERMTQPAEYPAAAPMLSSSTGCTGLLEVSALQ
jgi:hypothetical protein